MNLPDPRRELLYTAEPILQKSVVPETGFRKLILGIVDNPFRLCKVLFPYRVIHVDPRNYEIYIHI